MNLEEIGGRLKLVRTALKLSLEKIAKETGFSKSLISEAENGHKKPSSAYLYQLLGLYKVNINFIFTGEGDMFADQKSVLEKEDDLKEMFFYMEHVNLVRYSILGFFIDYKTRNSEIINELLESALEQKK